MRKLSKVAIAVAITVSAACSGIAYAQTSHADQVTQQQDEARLADGLNSTRQESTNKNLVMLLLTGTGPMADAHPEVVDDLGFKKVREKPAPEQAEKFADYFLKENPTFQTEVAEPVLSGNPLKVEKGLKNVTKMSQETFDHISKDKSNPTIDFYGSGHVGLWHDAITAAEVLANGAIYANAVVATQLAVAGAAVVVVVIVLDYNFTSDKMSPIEREHTIANLTNSLHDIENQ